MCDLFGINTCEWYNEYIQSLFLFFAWRCLFVPAQLAEKIIWAPLYLFCSFVGGQLIIFMWVYSWALLFHWSTCLVTSVSSITLLISFSIVMAFLGIFASLQTICLYPQNTLLAFWLRLIESIGQIGKNWSLNNIGSSYPWTPRARHLGEWGQVGLRKHYYEQS